MVVRSVCAVRLCAFIVLLMVPLVSRNTIQASPPWFAAIPVAENTWCIDDNGNDNIYLVVGDKRAMLIDTGTGGADLAVFCQKMTKLPVIVINTHAHPDHSGGNSSFNKVYVHPADFDAAHQFGDRGKKAELLPVKNGEIFDLGGRTLEVIETPGHTSGSICLLDKKNKILFAGDTINTMVWLFLRESRPLEVYLSSLQKVNKRAKEFGSIMPGHGTPLDSDFLDEMVDCTKSILNGGCSGEPYDTFAGSGRICMNKRASVVFNPDNLRKKP